MSTYLVRLNDGHSFRFSADLTQASAPIWLLDEDGERQTPFQTADARHQERKAATLLISYFDMAVQPGGTVPDDFGPGQAAAMIVNVIENPVTVEDLENVQWDVKEPGVTVFEQELGWGDGADAQGFEVGPISYALGHLTLEGDVEDRPLELHIGFAANGKTDGTYLDLYEFEIGLWNEQTENPVWLTGDATLINQDGEKLDHFEVDDVLNELANDRGIKDIWTEAVEAALPEAPEPEDIDEDEEESKMEQMTLRRDDDRDIRFTGELIAETSSKHYEGPRSTRWTELNLYRTQGGKLVCQQIGRTCWQGETDRYTVYVADDEQALVRQVGTGWLAKDLYDEAGIECIEDVD